MKFSTSQLYNLTLHNYFFKYWLLDPESKMVSEKSIYACNYVSSRILMVQKIRIGNPKRSQLELLARSTHFNITIHKKEILLLHNSQVFSHIFDYIDEEHCHFFCPADFQDELQKGKFVTSSKDNKFQNSFLTLTKQEVINKNHHNFGKMWRLTP